MTARIESLRERARRSYIGPNPEAGRLREQSLAATEGEPSVIREAEAFAYDCRHRAVVIWDGELLVGSRPGICHGDAPPEVHSGWRQAYSSPWPVPEDVELLFQQALLAPAGNHTTLNYDTVLSIGFSGLVERIDERLGRLEAGEAEAEEKRQFLEALKIMAEGYVDLCRRYADTATDLAASCADDRRRKELEAIAGNCRRVVELPPQTFWQACQAAWFSFLFLPDAPGRVDQYLRSFYEQDIQCGAITREFARELLSCLWLKYFEFPGAHDGVSARHHLTLGGVRPDGADASNDLTWLGLEVTEELALHRPQVGLRWNANTPSDLLRRAVRVLRNQTTNPDFCNDEQIVPALARTGIAIEDARDFSLSGCHEVIITGKAQMGAVEGFINLPKVLRMVLGLEPDLGEGADLGSIDSYDELWETLVRGMDFAIEGAHEASLCRDRREAEVPGGHLAASLVVSDCIENARGYTQGGARYNHCNWDIVGAANLGDSLVAMRRLVFEERVMTLAELVEALRRDWEGFEALRERVLNELPHFGNDDDEVDAVVGQVIEAFAELFKRPTPFRGGEYNLGTLAGGENMQIEFGRMTGATPDGRRAGEPLADSAGSAQGRDRAGITALLNSVAKLPHHLLPTSTTLNVKLDPKLLETEAGVEKVAALIESHFRAGGQQLQFNMHDRETLLEAKRCPEKHQNLMVRVAGYSAPFVTLWEDLQDEIIARTEHTV